MTTTIDAVWSDTETEFRIGRFRDNVRVGQFVIGTGAAVTTIAGMVALALGLWLTVSDIPDIRGNEPHVVFSIQKVLLGGSLYGDPSDVPFDITQYSPLYYATVIGLARLVGVPGDDASGITLLCRGTSVALTMVLLLVLYRFMRRHLGISAVAAIVTCAFSAAVTSPWYFMSRPDALMALCMFSAFYAALSSWRAMGTAAYVWIVITALLSVLAAASKQNGILAFGVIFVSLLLSQSWGRLTVATVAYGCFASVAAGLTYLTLGSELWANLVKGLDNGTSFYKALLLCYEPFFFTFSPLVGFAAITTVAWFRPRRDPVATFFSVSLVLLLGFAVVTALKVGSAVNYFNEFKLMAAMTTAALLTHGLATDSAARRYAAPLRISVAAYLAVFLACWMTVQSYQFFYVRREPGTLASAMPLRYSAYDELESWLRHELTGDPGAYFFSFEWAVSNLLPEHCVAPQWGLATLSFERGVVDDERLCEMLERGDVRYIIARSERLPSTLFGVSLQAYERVGTISKCNVFAHRRSRAVRAANQAAVRTGNTL